MKLELKRGGLRVLNIYTVAHRTLLGYAYLAQDAAQVGELDGVVDYGRFRAAASTSTAKATPRRTRWATGSTCSTRSTAAATAGTRSRTPRRKPLLRSTARSDGIRARATTGTTRSESHGLHAGQLHVPLQQRPGRADAPGLGRVPRDALHVRSDRR